MNALPRFYWLDLLVRDGWSGFKGYLCWRRWSRRNPDRQLEIRFEGTGVEFEPAPKQSVFTFEVRSWMERGRLARDVSVTRDQLSEIASECGLEKAFADPLAALNEYLTAAAQPKRKGLYEQVLFTLMNHRPAVIVVQTSDRDDSPIRYRYMSPYRYHLWQLQRFFGINA